LIYSPTTSACMHVRTCTTDASAPDDSGLLTEKFSLVYAWRSANLWNEWPLKPVRVNRCTAPQSISANSAGRVAALSGRPHTSNCAEGTSTDPPDRRVLTLCCSRLVVEREVALLREGASGGVNCDGAVVELHNVVDRIRHPGSRCQWRATSRTSPERSTVPRFTTGCSAQHPALCTRHQALASPIFKGDLNLDLKFKGLSFILPWNVPHTQSTTRGGVGVAERGATGEGSCCGACRSPGV